MAGEFRGIPDLVLEDCTERVPGTRDTFWSMEDNMTVFGSGLLFDHKDARWMHLTETPAEFVVAVEYVPEETEGGV
jgi:hypothetical protein